jgi:hypothetical protein
LRYGYARLPQTELEMKNRMGRLMMGNLQRIQFG